MKLEKLTKGLALAKKYRLDGTDLSILQYVLDKQDTEDGATIMKMSREEEFASLGTIHTRIKRMVDTGYLVKRIENNNLRFKKLEAGKQLQAFLDRLTELA